ncbi:GDP-mannose 4,6-dehydratase [soil metagenome]
MDTGSSILVTGGAGFIGANLVDRALQTGQRVTILDDLSRQGAEENLRWLRERHGEAFRLMVRSVTDAEACERAIDDSDLVFHLAGQVAVTSSILNPRQDFEVNALGTLNVLEAIRKSSHQPAMIYSSTNKVYGALEGLATNELESRYILRDFPNGINEDHPADFHSPYGCSKGAADQYVHDYARIYGMRTIVFRQSCVYGPRQMGVEDQGWVAWFLIAAATGKPITIYGNGKQVRDLLFIEDLLNGYDAALRNIDQSAGEIYNLGGGASNAISVWCEFMPILEQALDRVIPEPSFAPARAGDQAIFVADTSKFQHHTGWSPATSVSDGIALLAEWVAENRQLFD